MVLGHGVESMVNKDLMPVYDFTLRLQNNLVLSWCVYQSPIQPLGRGLTFWIRVNVGRANGAEVEKSAFAPIVLPLAEPDDFRNIAYTSGTSAQQAGLLVFFPAFSLDS